MSNWGSIYFSNGNSLSMESLLFFYDYTMLFIVLIFMLVGMGVYSQIKSKCLVYSSGYENMIEILWTVIPIGILVMILIPSLKVLYFTEFLIFCSMTLKIMGNQWFWTYSLPELGVMNLESYMEKEIFLSHFRLLDTDNNIVIPYLSSVRLLVSSNDVIHSWTLPSLGVKVDAIPGRINQSYLYCNLSGIYYGQCSEICGANHSFMPIKVAITSMNEIC